MVNEPPNDWRCRLTSNTSQRLLNQKGRVRVPEDENARDNQASETQHNLEKVRDPAIRHKYGQGKEQPAQPDDKGSD
jgi:hypothetical protein